MLGEFVGAGEPTVCIEWLIGSGIGDLTLIANTPGLRGGFGKTRLFASGQIREFIGTHVGTTCEFSEAYLGGRVRVSEFFHMGTWAEKVRAYASVTEARASIARYLDFCNRRRPHQGLAGQTLDQAVVNAPQPIPAAA